MAQGLLAVGIFFFLFEMVLSKGCIPDEILDACKKELAFDGDISTMNLSDPNSPKSAKCFLACALEKQNVLKNDLSLDREAAAEVIRKVHSDDGNVDKFINILDECIAEVDILPDKCETAFNFIRCQYVKKSSM